MTNEHGTATGGAVHALGPQAVVQAAAALGVDRDRLLRDARVRPELLEHTSEGLPLERYLTLYRIALERSGNADLGLYVGHILYFSGLNLHLYMTTFCRTLKEYVNVIPSTIRLRGDTGRVLIRPEGDTIRLEWLPLDMAVGGWRPLVDEMLVSALEIIRAICALPVPVKSVEFAYPLPDDTQYLKRVFGSNLRFGSEVSCIHFPREVLRYPLIRPAFELSRDFVSVPAQVFTAETNSDPFLRDTRAAIRRSLPGGAPNIDNLALEMGISRRTLQRRLSSHGTSFKRMLQDVRIEQALRYLDDPRLAITEIALLLGYSDQASFSNAFKVWHGCAPSEYRHRERRGA